MSEVRSSSITFYLLRFILAMFKPISVSCQESKEDLHFLSKSKRLNRFGIKS